MKFHEKILTLRHQVYAHSDGSNFKVNPDIWEATSTSIFGGPFYKLSQDEITSLSYMIEKLTVEVSQKQKELELELAKLKRT